MNKKLLSLVGLFLVGAASAATTLKTGTAAPDFSLKDVNGKPTTLSQYKGKFVVLEWTNYDCPFVKKHYDSANMQTLQSTYTAKNVIWLSINSSAGGKQGNFTSAEWLQKIAEKEVASTAVLLDESGKVGKQYGAKTTPHIFIVNPEGMLIYQGAIDSKASYEKNDIPSSTNYVASTLDAAMAGKPVSPSETDSYGCSVKYK